MQPWMWTRSIRIQQRRDSGMKCKHYIWDVHLDGNVKEFCESLQMGFQWHRKANVVPNLSDKIQESSKMKKPNFLTISSLVSGEVQHWHDKGNLADPTCYAQARYQSNSMAEWQTHIYMPLQPTSIIHTSKIISNDDFILKQTSNTCNINNLHNHTKETQWNAKWYESIAMESSIKICSSWYELYSLVHIKPTYFWISFLIQEN